MTKTLFLLLILIPVVYFVIWGIYKLVRQANKDFDFDAEEEERRIREMNDAADRLDNLIKTVEKDKNTNA